MLTPKTIEILVKHLYSRLARERKTPQEKINMVLPIREAEKLKNAILKKFTYEPYIYDPTSGT